MLRHGWSGERAGRSERSAPAAWSRPSGTRRRPAAQAPALGDGPHDQALAPAHVAGHEHAGHVGHEVVVAGDVAALVERRRRAGRATRPCSGPTKPIARSTSSAGSSRSVPSTFCEPAVDHLDLVEPQRPHVAVAVAEEALGVDAVHPLAALLVGRRDLCRSWRHCGHGLASAAVVGRAGHDLELVHRRRALAVGGAEAVGAGVAAADDHDVLAVRRRSATASRSPSCTRLASGRYSIAWWMPSSSRPGHRAGRATRWRRTASTIGVVATPAARRRRRRRRRRRWCGTRCPRPPSGRGGGRGGASPS